MLIISFVTLSLMSPVSLVLSPVQFCKKMTQVTYGSSQHDNPTTAWNPVTHIIVPLGKHGRSHGATLEDPGESNVYNTYQEEGQPKKTWKHEALTLIRCPILMVTTMWSATLGSPLGRP